MPVILHLSVRGRPGVTPDGPSAGSLHRRFPREPAFAACLRGEQFL